MGYKRIPGGEKTEKTGVSWTKEELLQVYKLFEKLNGVGIHEHNPEIQNLAKTLKRGVRATEAQLLMFRALSRGKEYSRKNMNSICEGIWEEYEKSKKMAENIFLVKLLSYEQDQETAISAPQNWEEAPILEIETRLDFVINGLVEKFTLKESENVNWHFLIGGPGNGKSAAIGKLFRVLKKEGVTFKDRDKNEIDFIKDPLPYEICCFRKDEPYSFAYLAQDASAVKDEFKENKKDISSANDLIDLFNHVYDNKRSLVVCANRGVIEDALTYKEKFVDEKLHARIRHLYYKADTPQNLLIGTIKKKEIQIEFSKTILDNKSILYQDGNHYPIKDLINKAINEDNWSICQACNNKTLCPFFNNRVFLYNGGNEILINFLRKAELFSAQIIVFREALAILSFLLAGCSDDYVNYEGSPCKWVEQNVNQKRFLTLIGRRVYFSLFSAFSSYGLMHNHDAFEEQLSALLKITNRTSSVVFKELKERTLSNNFGVKRLFSSTGIFREIDPIFNIDSYLIEENWTTSATWFEAKIKTTILYSELEENLAKLMRDVEEHLEDSDRDILIKQKWYKIWITSIIYKIAAVNDQITGFNEELLELTDIFKNREKSVERLESFSRIAKELFETIQETDKSIYLSPMIRIKGDFHEKFKPNLSYPKGENLNDLSLTLKFKGSKLELPVYPKTLVWLMRKSKLRISRVTFPTELLDHALKNQVKVAGDLKYNIEDEMVLEIGRNEKMFLATRYPSNQLKTIKL